MMREIAADARDWRAILGGPALSRRVLDAMGAVPRHEFVPPELRGRAYENNPLPIGHDQTISQPSIVALMTELLRVAPGDTVLEIGTGSGYQAAVLAQLGAVVHSIEIVPELADGRGAAAGAPGLRPGHGPRRRRLRGLAGPGAVPRRSWSRRRRRRSRRPLVEQLAPGGRLVLPVGPPHAEQQLMVIEKDAAGATTSRRILPVRFVPLIHG